MKKEYGDFSFEEFKKVINGLEKEKIEYFVFGGFVIDAILDELKNHDDLDIVFFEKDKEKIKNFFKKLGYKTYSHGRKWDFRKDNFKIDLLFITDKQDYYEIVGNIAKDILPKEIFNIKNKVTSNDFEFNAMPYEWLKLYENIVHHVPEKTIRHKKSIEKIREVFIKHENLRQERLVKPQNMGLIEI